MKLNKIILAIPAAFTIGLYGCNGGGNSSPASNTQYGQLISSSQLTVNPNVDFVATQFTESQLNAGFEPDQPPAIANIRSLGTLYNYANSENPTSASMIQFIENYAAAANVTGFSAYSVVYNTPGVHPETSPADISRTVSGLAIIPQMAAGQLPRGIVIYYHGTTFSKNNVPSCLASAGSSLPAYCNIAPLPSGTDANYYQLAATYAARGFIVLAPDYVGQGIDYNGVHPYVAYPENDALTGLNMIPAVKKLLSSLNYSLPSNLPLFLTGYSEGGGYALKASQLAQTTQASALQAENVSLKMTSPAEGAYALEQQMNFAFANLQDGLFNGSYGNDDMMDPDSLYTQRIPGVVSQNNWDIVWSTTAAASKPELLGYVLAAIMYYDFHNLSSAYSQILYDQFWQSIPVEGVGNLNLFQLFTTPTLSDSQITSALLEKSTGFNGYNQPGPLSFTLYIPNPTPQNPLNVESTPVNLPALPVGYGNNNQALRFVIEAGTQTPQFDEILDRGSTYAWSSNSPINFIHLNFDSVVAVANTNTAYNYMINSSAGKVESTIIPNFQIVNNGLQLLSEIPNPFGAGLLPNQFAQTGFWAYNPVFGPILKTLAPPQFASLLALPNDHSDSVTASVANIVALCTFENALKNNTNSGVCPNLAP